MTSQSFSAWRQASTAAGAVLLLSLVWLEWYQQVRSPFRWDAAMGIAVAMATLAMVRWLRDAPAATRLRTLLGFVLSFGFAIVVGADRAAATPIDGMARFVVPSALGWLAVALIVAPRNAYIIDRKRWEVDAGRDSVVVTSLAAAGTSAYALIGLPGPLDVPRLLAGTLLAATGVVSVYRIGRLLISREAGYAAGVLFAAQPDLVREAAAVSPHAMSMAALPLATLLLLRTYRGAGAPSAVAAGVCIGLLGMVETTPAIVLGACIWLWTIVVSGPGLSRVLRVLAWVTLGILLPAAAMLAYRRLGSADLVLGRPPAIATDYGTALWTVARRVLPLFLVVPVVVIAYARRVRLNWILALLFVPFAIVVFFQSGDAAHHLVELLPFVFIGLGALLAMMWREGMLQAGAFAVLVIGQVAATVLMILTRSSWP